MTPGSWWAVADDGITISVRVTPGARRSEVIDTSGDRLRLRVAAPAVEGKANVEVERFVARLFGVRRSAVTLLRGERSREKTIRVAGPSTPPADLHGNLSSPGKP